MVRILPFLFTWVLEYKNKRLSRKIKHHCIDTRVSICPTVPALIIFQDPEQNTPTNSVIRHALCPPTANMQFSYVLMLLAASLALASPFPAAVPGTSPLSILPSSHHRKLRALIHQPDSTESADSTDELSPLLEFPGLEDHK